MDASKCHCWRYQKFTRSIVRHTAAITTSPTTNLDEPLLCLACVWTFVSENSCALALRSSGEASRPSPLHSTTRSFDLQSASRMTPTSPVSDPIAAQTLPCSPADVAPPAPSGNRPHSDCYSRNQHRLSRRAVHHRRQDVGDRASIATISRWTRPRGRRCGTARTFIRHTMSAAGITSIRRCSQF